MRSWSLLLAPSAVLTWLCTSHLQGIINLGTSENKLCFDLLSRRVSPTAPLSGIPSSEGLSFLGFPGMLPPESRLLASVAPVLESGDPPLPWGPRSLPSGVSYFLTLILLLLLFWLFPASAPPAGWVPALRGRHSVTCGQCLMTGPGAGEVLSVAFAESPIVCIPPLWLIQGRAVLSLHAELGREGHGTTTWWPPMRTPGREEPLEHRWERSAIMSTISSIV